MKKGKKLCQVLIPLSVAFTVIALFRWMFFIGYVPTSSMEPTLKTGSVLLGIRIIGSIETGDNKSPRSSCLISLPRGK